MRFNKFNQKRKVSAKKTNKCIRTSCYNFVNRETKGIDEPIKITVDIDYDKLVEAVNKAEELKQKELENMSAAENINAVQSESEKETAKVKKSLIKRIANEVSKFFMGTKNIIFFKKENASENNAIVALLGFAIDLMLKFIQTVFYILAFVLIIVSVFSLKLAFNGEVVILAIIYAILTFILAFFSFLFGRTFRIARVEVGRVKNEERLMSYFTFLTPIIGFIITASMYLINVFPFSVVKLLVELVVKLIGGLI